MKRNALGAALAAGLVVAAVSGGSARALELSPEGTGQVLIYPYYTVNRNQQTLISVVNATSAAKAVRVRFLEGYNAREVLDFNLFLSGFDVWTASVFALNDAGLSGDGAAMATIDTSCTAPHRDTWTGVVGGYSYQGFLPFAYSGAHADSGPEDLARTREGHVEMIHMADLNGSLRAAVTHVAGVPASCRVVQTIDPANPMLLPPSGGLFGAAGIVDVAQGTFYGYNADAIGGFSKAVLFSAPGTPTPSLAQANSAPGVATAYTFDAAGEMFRSDYPTGGQPGQAIDAVSAVFMASYLLNEYNVDPSIGSNTDWVVTFPTKRFYVDPEILGLPPGSAGALPPFNFTFGQQSSDAAVTNGPARSCSRIEYVPFDRDGLRPVPSPGFMQPPVVPPALCTSVNVISMLKVVGAPPVESGVLGSRLHTIHRPFATAGWLRLSLDSESQPHALRVSRDGDVFSGLPATGFQAVNYVHANALPGRLANYSATSRHRAVRTCVNAVTGNCP